MQLTSSAITINLNQNTTYSSVTGLWTLGNGHAYHNGVINNGYYFSGFMEKSNSNLSIPEGASTENIYFLFQDGDDIGLAISLENASAKTPIVFATAGDFFYFKQTGKTYNLNPILIFVASLITLRLSTQRKAPGLPLLMVAHIVGNLGFQSRAICLKKYLLHGAQLAT